MVMKLYCIIYESLKVLAIAGQLAQGVTLERVFDNIRDKIGDQFQRIHLLTRKDINNIERTYGVKGIQRHLQVCIFGMKLHDDNPVILYKHQGKL